jgi:hypothetical protein
VVDAEAVEHIGRKVLQACCTGDSSQQHWDRREHSAAEAVHKGHNHLRDSGAEVDTGDSESNNGHIEDVGADVGGADVEARMTDTAYDMEVVVVDA